MWHSGIFSDARPRNLCHRSVGMDRKWYIQQLVQPSICVGCITFLIGITGCVGALRENTAFLAAYTTFLLFLLIGEMCFGILVVVLKDKGWIKEQATDGLRAFITHYREDPDQQNLIDWIQEDWLQCCGIEGPKDWDSNNYFNCSSTTVGSREACGVPFSCCKRRPQEIIKNKQCGYDVRKEENVSMVLPYTVLD